MKMIEFHTDWLWQMFSMHKVTSILENPFLIIRRVPLASTALYEYDTWRNGKMKPMVKFDIQLRDPPTVYAAGRWDCLKSSAVIRNGTPAKTDTSVLMVYHESMFIFHV